MRLTTLSKRICGDDGDECRPIFTYQTYMQTTNITIILSVCYDYHYHHCYHHSYHNFIIITILCYASSVNTCTVGGAIQMTVYIYIYIYL